MGISIAVMWILFVNPFLAIIPALFMAFGDAVTGVLRNALYKKRTKSPVGNVFMLFVCIAIGYAIISLAAKTVSPIWSGTITTISPLWGVATAVAASIIERFEIGPVDDNVLITIVTIVVLAIIVIVGWP